MGRAILKFISCDHNNKQAYHRNLCAVADHGIFNLAARSKKLSEANLSKNFIFQPLYTTITDH